MGLHVLKFQKTILLVGSIGGKFHQKRQKTNFASLCFISNLTVLMTWGALLSVKAPFYPEEARKKGATVSEVDKCYNYDEQIPKIWKTIKYYCDLGYSLNSIIPFQLFIPRWDFHSAVVT